VSYLVLFAGTATVAALLIDSSVLSQNLGRPVGPADYAVLAWIITSLATVGGAIGSGLEDEDNVRAAAYGYHPTPTGGATTPHWTTADRAARSTRWEHPPRRREAESQAVPTADSRAEAEIERVGRQLR